jgi:hypothetical protein
VGLAFLAMLAHSWICLFWTNEPNTCRYTPSKLQQLKIIEPVLGTIFSSVLSIHFRSTRLLRLSHVTSAIPPSSSLLDPNIFQELVIFSAIFIPTLMTTDPHLSFKPPLPVPKNSEPILFVESFHFVPATSSHF